MNSQHCGRMDTHDEHFHQARLRRLIPLCVCTDNPCTCTELEEIYTRRRVTLECPGVIVTEGAPRHLSVVVDL